uniref:Uncharacterized protein n=1 Tax=Arundo donax TaxID=35708 RepID=A0A0A9B4F1_ARUDO
MCVSSDRSGPLANVKLDGWK